jgi:hypothetical protein
MKGITEVVIILMEFIGRPDLQREKAEEERVRDRMKDQTILNKQQITNNKQQNNKITKQQNNKITKQQNNKITKQQNNKITKQQNNKTTK